MPLIQDDFYVLKAYRTASAGSADTDFLGKANHRADGGIASDATSGATWRNTVPSELVTSLSDADNYEVWTDGQGSGDETEYHNFVDYHKLYVVNSGDEDLDVPRLYSSGLTAPASDEITDIWSTYMALGLVDETDYSERTAASTSDDYADGTREGFPTHTFNAAATTASLTETKVAESIVRIGTGTDKLEGPHRVVRMITADSELYNERKYIKAEWTGSISTAFRLYVIGETNGVFALGRLQLSGTDGGSEVILDASDDTSDITFERIYGWFAIDNAETITTWNDITKAKIVNPDQAITISYRVSTDADIPANWKTWSEAKNYGGGVNMGFGLTFFDERIIYYPAKLGLIANSASILQTRNPSTTTATLIINDANGYFFTVSPDDQIGYVEFDSPDADLSSVKLGDRVIGVDQGTGDSYDLGYVVEVGASPTYPTLTTSIFPEESAALTALDALDLYVIDGTESRMAFWFRREIACQSSAPTTVQTSLFWRVMGQ